MPPVTRLPLPEDDPVLRWVKRLNDLGHQLDENAKSLHPAAWPEALGPDRARWQALAKEGPR